MADTVRRQQRWTEERPCPICGGWDRMPRGRGTRCAGYMGTDGKYAHCSREDCAGNGLEQEAGGTYAHRLEGPCRCGATHGDAPVIDMHDRRPTTPRSRVELNRREAGTWDYDTGLRVVRLEFEDGEGRTHKEYIQRHKHADGRYAPGLNPGDRCPPGCTGAARTLYRLAELAAADPTQWVWFVEGEKCVETLRHHGFVATTTPGGANGFRHASQVAATELRRRHVVVLPDHDKPGKDYAKAIVEALKTACSSLRVLELPGLTEGEDVVDWLARGGEGEDLVKLAEPCPNLSQRMPIISDAARSLWASPLPPALPTGIRGLDRIIGGLRAESMVVLNGPPGKGKTGLAIQAARFISLAGRPTIYLTLELSERQAIARFVAQERRVPWLRVFELGPSEAEAVAYDARNMNLRVVRPSRKSTITGVLDRFADEVGQAPVVFLDYLQYAATWSGNGDLRVAVGALSQEIGTWIVDARSTGMIISATARASYKHEEGSTAEDFVGAGKESGQIDFDASAELFLESDPCPEGGTAPARLHVPKNRFGAPNQTVGLIFHGAIGVFHDDPLPTLSDTELQCLRAIERGAASTADILDKDHPFHVKARRDAVLKAVRSLRAKGLVDGPPLRRLP